MVESAEELTREELLLRYQQSRSAQEKLNLKVEQLEAQLQWFHRQLFGTKSERRLPAASGTRQLSFGEQILSDASLPAPASPVETVKSYARRRGSKGDLKEGSAETLLRFDENVPVEDVLLPCPEIEGLSPDEYQIIDHEQSYKLAQTPSSYVVIRYLRPIIKLVKSGTIRTAPLPPMVIDRSFSDVSFHAGSLVDKFVYHIPFNRQHQRLLAFGITVSRSTLPTQAIRAIELLAPVVDAQEQSVLSSRVMAMDDTWMNVGRAAPGKMHKGYFWPMYGDQDEIIFRYTESRQNSSVESLLQGRFKGVLIADGHSAYDRYSQKHTEVTRAQDWVHARRNFFELLGPPELREAALERIGRMFELEQRLRKKQLIGEAKLAYRGEHVKPVVEEFFEWLRSTCNERMLLPSDPFLKAAVYALKREWELKVFLSNPDVPMDTNHIERALRVIPMGRRNYLFCWTELGAKSLAAIQSLLVTCKLHDIDPYAYLVDVLQRISFHPQRRVAELTPRLWKQHFAGNPLLSPLETARRQKEGLQALQKIAS